MEKTEEQIYDMSEILESYGDGDYFMLAKRGQSEEEKLFEINQEHLFEDYIRLLKFNLAHGMDPIRADNVAYKDALEIQESRRNEAREAFILSHQKGEE